MASLVVGGVSIPVAVSSPSFSRSDAVDRGRTFDNTSFASQTGGAARAWSFTTPPVVPGTYEPTLGIVAAQLCSGDILALPTMCHVEFLGGKPVRAQGTKVTLDFTLIEVQPAKVLLRYAPGDTVTGESFSRSTVGTYFDAAGSLVDAAINVKRDGHYGPYDAADRSKRMLKLERTRTNHIFWASDFSNAVWGKNSITPTTGVPGMRSGSSANTLTATASSAYVNQAQAAGSSVVLTNSIWARRRTGTGAVLLYAADGSTYQELTLTASYKRFTVISSATTARYFEIDITTSGDAIDVENAQTEDGAFASSEIQSTSAALPRGADSYSLPFTSPPVEMTVYAKIVERGTINEGTRLFGISSAGDANPLLYCLSSGGKYTIVHGQASGSRTSAPAVAPVIGDTVEIMCRLFGDGSVDITQTINGAAATSGVQSAALALATAWSGQLVWLNSAGTAGGQGFVDLQSFKIIAGSRSLAEMRAL